MEPARIVTELSAIRGRGPCTDAERRGGGAGARRRAGGRPRRPQWAAIWLLHALLALAGSVVSVDQPEIGLGVAAVAALSGLGELTGRFRLLALLWPRRATQNVVAPAPDEASPVKLIVTAPYDAARAASGTARGLGR